MNKAFTNVPDSGSAGSIQTQLSQFAYSHCTQNTIDNQWQTGLPRGETNTNHSLFRIFNLNIGGLTAKLVSNYLIDYLNTFDLICLTETFVYKVFKITVLKEFIFFYSSSQETQ